MIKPIAALSFVALLSACAAPAPAPAPATAGAAGAATPVVADAPITGSRLSRTTTHRNVRTIDNATFKEENSIKSLGNLVPTPGS